MTKNKSLVRFLPGRLRNYLNVLQGRLDRLETLAGKVTQLEMSVANLATAVDTLIESPRHIRGSDSGFNWQSGRKKIFSELLQNCHFQFLVETGTWVGNTTGYMADASQLPVFSSDLDKRFHSLARMRLSDMKNVSLFNRDSRDFLRELSVRPDLAGARMFFYLDAHWRADLPLSEEIGIIARSWSEAVIMIDDFQVPHDPGYGYDDYGPGKKLDLAYLGPSLSTHHLAAFFPSIPSAEETGRKRGCVVVARRGPMSMALENVSSLRRGATMFPG